MPVFKIKQNGEWVDIAGGSGGGEIPDNLVYVSEENQESTVVPLDADTLNGKTENMLSVANADTIEGYSVNSLIDKIYPVGSIYMSVNAVSPATLFGGTWEALKDRFLLGAGSTYSAGSTGGEAKHTLTVAEMPSHCHTMLYSGGTASDWGYNYSNSGGTTSAQTTASGGVGLTGGSQPHNNMPPYLSVYMWKRTA